MPGSFPIAALAFALAFTLPASPGARAETGPPSASATAARLAETAEDFVDPYLTPHPPAECGASAVAALRQGIRELERLAEPVATSPAALLGGYLVGEVERACQRRDPLRAAIAADQLTLLLEPLVRFAPSRNAGLARLDYLGREIVLLADPRATTAAEAMNQPLAAISAAWRQTRQAFAPLKAAGAAVAAMDRAVAALASGAAVAQRIAAAREILDLVDRLEGVK
jgi:hypothetical protein